MKTFRGKEVLGWRILKAVSHIILESDLDDLMEKYEFIDSQYSTTQTYEGNIEYSMAVLIAEKSSKRESLKYGKS